MMFAVDLVVLPQVAISRVGDPAVALILVGWDTSLTLAAENGAEFRVELTRIVDPDAMRKALALPKARANNTMYCVTVQAVRTGDFLKEIAF